MHIVVTGALGHIGSRLIRDLPTVFPRATITLIDNLSTQRYASLFNLPKESRYKFIEGDILKLQLANIISAGDYVIHLAALTDAAVSAHTREELEQVNYQGTVRVAKACAATRAKLVYISSTSVYTPKGTNVDEFCSKQEASAQSPYAASKLKGEVFLSRLKKKEALKYTICRFGTICGISPGMRFHTAVNRFCWQSVNNQPMSVWKTAYEQYRPYLSLSDATAAMMFFMKRDIFDGNIYNVVTDNLTVHDIITNIQQDIKSATLTFIDSPIMNNLSYHVETKRLRELGFRFNGSIKKDIKQTIKLLKGVVV